MADIRAARRPKLAAEYLNAAAEDKDHRVYLSALRTVAEAKGMAKVARAVGVPRESIIRALSSSGTLRRRKSRSKRRVKTISFTNA
jgi:probable addiction module antidote protein